MKHKLDDHHIEGKVYYLREDVDELIRSLINCSSCRKFYNKLTKKVHCKSCINYSNWERKTNGECEETYGKNKKES